jgi:hypothetical protein
MSQGPLETDLTMNVRTFDLETGEEIHIEVKTTTGPAETPF